MTLTGKITILLLLVTQYCSAQHMPDWETVLKARDLDSLEKFASSFNRMDKEGKIDDKLLRDIFPGYKEGIYYFRKCTLSDTFPNRTYACDEYRLRLIAREHTLIWYEWSQEVYDETEADSETNGKKFSIVKQYSDSADWKQFRADFKRKMQADLKEKDLFNEAIHYGRGCGFGSQPPEEREWIDRMAARNKRAVLLQWLQSANTEKQVYAYDIYWQWKRKRKILTSQETTLLKLVEQKRGTMRACQGCFVGNGWQLEIVLQSIRDRKKADDITGYFEHDL